MLFGLRPIYLAKFCRFFVVLSMFVFPFVVVRRIPDKVRSQLLLQEVSTHLDKDFSL